MTVVIFDLGNVILPFDYMLCCRRLAGYSPYSSQQIYQHVFKSQLICAYEAGGLSSEEFFAQLQAELKLELDFSDFRSIWGDIFDENLGVSQIIHRLKNGSPHCGYPHGGSPHGGYRLFLLSNTNELHFEYVYQKFSVLNLFEEYILSYRVGYMKPDDHIYQQALMLAGIPAEEIIYIDDRLEYAQAAARQGIQGIHFTRAPQLEQELINCGIRLSASVREDKT